VTGDLKLVLLDPTAAVTSNNSPTAGTNPQLVDSGLTAPPSSSGNADDANVFGGFETGTVNSVTGAVTAIHSVRVAYLKGGKLFTADTVPGHSHVPVQVSSIANACGFQGGESVDLADFANPLNGWLLVGLPGTNGTCYDGDDTYVAVKLSTAASAGGVAVAGLQGALALHDSSGAIKGFLDGVKNGDGTLTLQHRDVNFATPVTLATTASGTEAKVAEAGLSVIYFAYEPNGQGSYQLFRYDVSAGTLAGPLYTFVNGKPQGFKNSTANANNFFFPDGNLLLRIGRNITTAGTATLMTTLTGGLIIDQLALTNNLRVVGSASDNSSNSGLIFSVPNSASNVVATPLQTSGTSGTTITNARLQTVDSSGLVYINVTVNGTGGSNASALLIHDDASGASSTANAQWAGEVDSPDIANVQITSKTAPVAVLRDVVTNASSGSGTHTLTSVTSSTGVAAGVLGAIDNCQFAESFGIGRYIGILAQVQHTGGPDQDAYFADAQTAASLKAVSTVDGMDVYAGG